MGQPETPPAPIPDPTNGPKGFVPWLWSKGKVILSIGFVSSLTVVLSASDSIWGLLGKLKFFQHPFLWIFGFQILLVLATLIWNVKPAGLEPYDVEDRDRTAVNQLLKDFYFWWRCLIVIWGITYGLYAAQEVMRVNNSGGYVPNWMFVILIKGEMAAFLAFYITLSQGRTEGDDVNNSGVWIVILFLLFLLTIGEIVNEKIAGPGSPKGAIASAISCSVLCVGIAMFVGRLDSQRLPTHPSISAALYLYAAIQPLFPLASNNFVAFLFAASLLLKALTALYVGYLMHSGLLGKYIGASMRVPKLRPHV